MPKIKVSVKRVCGCVIKNDLDKEKFFPNKEEALEYAKSFLEILKENSCHTHNFFIEEKENSLVINSDLNKEIFSLHE